MARRGRLEVDIHLAASQGNVDLVVALLSSGAYANNPDVRGPGGWTPLLCAVEGGHAEVVTVLLESGAKTSAAIDEGFTALHISARDGKCAIAEMLVKAGSDLVAVTHTTGATPLHLAAEGGHSAIMTVLIEAGADLDYRTHEGDTPLYTSCEHAKLEAVRVLLRAGANPLLTSTDTLGQTFRPLDVAAFKGHYDVARELVQHLGVEGCGGKSRGVDALRNAAQTSDVGMMAILMDAGVVDSGEALVHAAGYGGEAPVKFLLQRRQRQQQQLSVVGTTRAGDAYVDARDSTGKTAVIGGILLCRSSSPRVVRMLLDAGADTVSKVQLSMPDGVPFFHGNPLDFVKVYVGQKKEGDASGETLKMLEAIRRMLLRVEAIHAVSWLWHSSDNPTISDGADGGKTGTKTASAAAASQLARMLPLLRRRANRHGFALTPLFR